MRFPHSGLRKKQNPRPKGPTFSFLVGAAAFSCRLSPSCSLSVKNLHSSSLSAHRHRSVAVLRTMGRPPPEKYEVVVLQEWSNFEYTPGFRKQKTEGGGKGNKNKRFIVAQIANVSKPSSNGFLGLPIAFRSLPSHSLIFTDCCFAV